MNSEYIATYNDQDSNAPMEEMKNKFGVADAASNLDMHLPEICDFGRKHKLTFGKALDYTIKTSPGREPDPDLTRNLFIRNDIKLEPDRYGPSSPLDDILKSDGLMFLMHEYQKDVFFDGIHTNRFWHSPHLSFAPSITRTEARDTSSNLQTVGMTEVQFPMVTDVQVADIIGERTVIENNRYYAPIVEDPDFKLTKIGEIADIRPWRLTTSDKNVVTTKAGFGIMRSYEASRSSMYYVEQITALTNRIRHLTQQDLVNEGLTTLTSGTYSTANKNLLALASTTMLDGRDIININLQARKGRKRKCAYNLIICNDEFLIDYGGVDLVQNTEAGFPLTPANRSYVDSIRAGQIIAYRDSDEVVALTSNNASYLGTGITKGAFFVDRRFGLRYILERNSMVEEAEINAGNQSMTDFNTFSYAFMRMEEAQEAVLKVTVAS